MDNATAIAAGLSEYVGVRRAVPVYMDKSCVAHAAFMGVVMTDNFYVLLEPGHPAERIHGILDTLEADIIVTNRKNEKKAAKLEFAGKIILSRGHMAEQRLLVNQGQACFYKGQLT